MIARSRLVTVVLSVLLVTAAAIGFRLSDATSENALVRAPLDTAVAYQSGTVEVSDVRVATTLRQADEQLTTRGLFVVVHVAVRASGRDPVLIGDTRLVTTSGTTYDYALTWGPVIKADPGFEKEQDYVFEVDPARIDDLTLELWDKGITYRYYERTQTPLGITAANAAQWARAGAGRTLVVARDADVSALS